MHKDENDGVPEASRDGVTPRRVPTSRRTADAGAEGGQRRVPAPAAAR